MQVQMLESCKGTQDGQVVVQFNKGDVVDISVSLARQFFKEGKAEKTIDQRNKEWKELLSQDDDEIRNFEIGLVEESLKENGNTFGLRVFRQLQDIHDMMRESTKSIDKIFDIDEKKLCQDEMKKRIGEGRKGADVYLALAQEAELKENGILWLDDEEKPDV